MKKKISVISPCPVELNGSLSTFEWKKYRGFQANVAFLNPKNELLLVKGEEGWQLPSEKVIGSHMLINCPVRVHEDVLGGERYSQLESAPGRRPRILGAFEEDGVFNVVILAYVKNQFFKNVQFAKWGQINTENSAVSMAVDRLEFTRAPGWFDKEAVAA